MIDVREHDTDVVAVTDHPGVERQKILVRLLDPRTLRISARQEEFQNNLRRSLIARDLLPARYSRPLRRQAR